MAEAALLADLALAMTMVGWLVTFFAVLQWLAAIPFGVLALRFRSRVVAMALLAVVSIGFLIGGLALVLQTYLACAMGVATAYGFKRGKGPLYSVLLSVTFGAVPTLFIAVALLEIFSKARKIILNQTLSAWRGVGNSLIIASNAFHSISNWLNKSVSHSSSGFFSNFVEGLSNWANEVSHDLKTVGHVLISPAAWVISHWWLVFPASGFIGILLLSFFVYFASRPVLTRIMSETDLDSPLKDLALLLAQSDNGSEICPVPVKLVDVFFKYPTSASWVLKGVSLELNEGSFLVIAGKNGSGKSTLGWLLSGVHPTKGVIERKGAPGLGQIHGTAMIFQRPESQVLGTRVIDDLFWGQNIEPDTSVLSQVGLEGFENRETSGLSGGELQRLAIASALTKNPKLLISDETTAMLDREGRNSVIRSLEKLTDEQTSVVHITHIREEIQEKNVRFLNDGSILQDQDIKDLFDQDLSQLKRHPYFLPQENRKHLVSVNNVSYIYSPKTPWQKVALKNVSMSVKQGDGIMIVGSNGSGKSTLAWLLAGLLSPSVGTVLWEGETDSKSNSMIDNLGKVFLVFQHVRLQLVRDTVKRNLISKRREVTSAEMEFALESVGLDPKEFLNRSIRQLSGGELRRVALAAAITAGSEVIVLDEPLSGLDIPSQALVIEALVSLRSSGKAVVVISHDFEQLENLVDVVIGLKGGEIDYVKDYGELILNG